MTEQTTAARAVDGANPSDVRDQSGAPVGQKRIAFTAVFNQEDAKAFAQLHASQGNTRRANELRTLIGEKTHSPFSDVFRYTYTLRDVIVVCALTVGTSYGLRKFQSYRAKKKLAASQATTPVAPVREIPPPFAVR